MLAHDSGISERYLAELESAVEAATPEGRAVVDAELDPIAAPEIDITSGEDGGAVTFDAVVEIRPVVSVAGYQGLQVTVPTLDVTDEDVQAQVDRLRGQFGELSEVSRPARDGDHVTIDVHGTRPHDEDIHVEDYLYEIGSGEPVVGLDAQLRGAKAGDILQFAAPVRSPEGTEDEADVRVLVKDVKEKILPEETDAWAAEASEFTSLDELRDDLRTRMRQVKVVEAQMAVRERTLDALIGLVAEDPPDALVDAEVRERLHDLGHRLQARRLTVEQFLQASGRDEAELLGEIRADAARAVRLDLALRALADAEDIQVTDDELAHSVAEMATQAGTTAADLRRRLDRTGRLPAVRSDGRKSKALTWLFDHVGLVDDHGAPVPREALELDEQSQGTADTGEVGPGDAADEAESGERGSEGVQADERDSGGSSA